MNPTIATRIGRYEFVTLLGEGGMARVYLAVSRGPVGFNKLVVVKQVRPELAWDRDFLTMFFDEARIAARLNHPNVISTHEVVEENGQYLLAMEYLEGHTLGEILQRLGLAQMPLEQHLWILTQVLAGLHYGHELRDYDGSPLGIVHRDVSPPNVFVTYNGEVKLLDFGIAKAAGAVTSTHKGTVKGKLGYGAPEQFLSKPVDARTDVYAVGVMLWEALAGKRRKNAETAATTWEARIAGLEPRIREVRPDVPTMLADICDRATAVEPDHRFASALQFQRAIERYLESRRRPVGQRDLATLINYHFSAERTAMRKRIEQQLMGTLSSVGLQTPPPPPSSPVTAVTLAEGGSHSSVDVAHQGSGGARPRPLPLRSSSRPYLMGALALAAVGAMIFFYVQGPQPGVQPPTPAAQAPSSTPSTEPKPSGDRAQNALATAPPTPESTKTVKVTIDVQPRRATVTLDGQLIEGLPFQANFPRDQKEHLVRASSPGFTAVERNVTFARDARVEIEMRRARDRAASRVGRNEPPPRVEPRPAGEPNRLEPGMDLRRPETPTPRRQIDEKDPYAQ